MIKLMNSAEDKTGEKGHFICLGFLFMMVIMMMMMMMMMIDEN